MTFPYPNFESIVYTGDCLLVDCAIYDWVMEHGTLEQLSRAHLEKHLKRKARVLQILNFIDR
eukprot:UN11412